MGFLEKGIDFANRMIWGPPLLIFLVFVGALLTVRLKGVQFRYLIHAHKLAFTANDEKAQGDISQFETLMTTLAATIGIGSITGVATAIAIGGMGALFWMWVAALLGMATRFGESILAVKYRKVDSRGEMCGGPMHYIEKGLSCKTLAVLFAVFGVCAAFGTGNMVQANSVSLAMKELFGIHPLVVGVALMVCTGATLFGGIKKIGKVASYLVPAMAIFYCLAAFIAILLNINHVPSAFVCIFRSAFKGQAASGGFIGSTMMLAIEMGISRGIFSSEAGLGSSPIAAAAARTDTPGRQAMISMCSVFITTGIVCTITGLVIALSKVLGTKGADGTLLNGSALALRAFEQLLPFGGTFVTIALVPFAYSTIIAWAYYGEKCVEYLLGERVIQGYRFAFTVLTLLGAILGLKMVWGIANIANGLMAFPNLIALCFLSSVIAKETRIFIALLKQES